MANSSKSTKFRAMKALDQWSADPTGRAERYGQALARLADPGFDLLGQTVAGIEGIVSNGAPDPMAHLDQHWLKGSLFPGLDPAAFREVVRLGFQSAIADAQKADLPLDVVWVDGGGEGFRVDHTVGKGAVTVSLVTPSPTS